MSTIITTNNTLVRYYGAKFILSSAPCEDKPDIVLHGAGQIPIRYGDLQRLLISRGERQLYSCTLFAGGDELLIRDMSSNAFWNAVKGITYDVIARDGLYAINPEYLREHHFSQEEDVLTFAITAFESGDTKSAYSVLVPAICYTLIPSC